MPDATRKMVNKFTLILVILLTLASCKFMGCFAISEACEDCCKKACVSLRGRLGSRQAFEYREVCTDECIEEAKKRGKDAYWVEENQACLYRRP